MQEGNRFSAGTAEPVRRLRAWWFEPPRVPEQGAEIRRWWCYRGDVVGYAEAELCVGDAGSAGRQADQGGIRHGGVTTRQRHDQGLFRASRDHDKTASRVGVAREPRPQSLYRRCGTALGTGEFYRIRAGWADIGGRLSR